MMSRSSSQTPERSLSGRSMVSNRFYSHQFALDVVGTLLLLFYNQQLFNIEGRNWRYLVKLIFCICLVGDSRCTFDYSNGQLKIISSGHLIFSPKKRQKTVEEIYSNFHCSTGQLRPTLNTKLYLWSNLVNFGPTIMLLKPMNSTTHICNHFE